VRVRGARPGACVGPQQVVAAAAIIMLGRTWRWLAAGSGFCDASNLRETEWVSFPLCVTTVVGPFSFGVRDGWATL
jgi:hypothetical protein